MRVSCCHHKPDNGLWHDNNVLFWWASVNSPGTICCWCRCWPKMSQTSICLKPVISTLQQILCSQHCCVLQLTPKYFSKTGFCALKSFNLALLFCLSFTIHIGSEEDLWRGVLDLTVTSQIKAMESSGLSRTRNPADLRESGSRMCLQALGTAANWIRRAC